MSTPNEEDDIAYVRGFFDRVEEIRFIQKRLSQQTLLDTIQKMSISMI
jgi:hypothetical protein